MWRTLYVRLRYGPYLRSEEGTKEFAEHCLSRLIGKVTRKSAFYREANENLLVEKANLRMLSEELARKTVLDSGEFFSVRRRLRAGDMVIGGMFLAAILLAYTSITPLLQAHAPLEVAAWGIATVLAVALVGGGLATTERLLEALLWHRRLEAQAGEARRVEAVVWMLALAAIELALLGMAEVRASLLAQHAGRPILYAATLAFVLVLPLLGGAIRWDALRYVDAYKRTRAHRHIETRLAQIDSILRQNEEFESNFYKTECLKAWGELVAFRTVKRTLDARGGRQETLHGHFAGSYRAFQQEANWRYETDLRDLTAPSLRKLARLRKAESAGNGRSLPYLLPASTNGHDGPTAAGHEEHAPPAAS